MRAGLFLEVFHMRKLGIAFVFAVVVTGAAVTLQAKSLFVIAHWNESTNQYTTNKVDLAGCTNHLDNHPEDYLVSGDATACVDPTP
jgi:hypothetical protein